MTQEKTDPLNRGSVRDVGGRYTMTTKNKYMLADVVSALQKELRRCNEKAAMFWAFEMCASTGEKNECGYAKYLWRRLAVIASEDIGLADPMAAILVRNLAANYERTTENYKKSAGQAIVAVAHAVLYLARTVKNREVDDAAMFLINEVQAGRMLPVPDYALDMHNPRGRQMAERSGRNALAHFYEVSARLENIAGSNHYGPLVGDVVNVDRYANHECPATAKWEPIDTRRRVGTDAP